MALKRKGKSGCRYHFMLRHQRQYSISCDDASKGKEEHFEASVWKSIKIPKGTQSAVQKGKTPRYYARAYLQSAE